VVLAECKRRWQQAEKEPESLRAHFGEPYPCGGADAIDEKSVERLVFADLKQKKWGASAPHNIADKQSVYMKV
jgi:hypothetical protein